jgi:hypothetical protein
MWWEPRSNAEELIARSQSRLRDMFLERIREETVFGVGTWFADGVLRPLLLVNHEHLGIQQPSLVLLDGDSIRGFEFLREWDLPENIVLLAVSRPEPSSASVSARPSSPIRSQDSLERGTLGAGLCPSGHLTPSAFLTVGHMLDGSVRNLGEVELIARKWPFPTRYVPIGKVVRSQSPFAQNPVTPSYDFAIVELHPNVFLKAAMCRGVAQVNGPIHQPEMVRVFGGVSGIVTNAAIVGSLLAGGGKYGVWLNSWILVPSGATADGDSGGLVTLACSGEAVGMIVGASTLPHSNVFAVQYVQDMQSICRDIIQPAGYQVWSK